MAGPVSADCVRQSVPGSGYDTLQLGGGAQAGQHQQAQVGPGGQRRTGGKGSRKEKYAEDEKKKEEVKTKLKSQEYILVRVDEGNPNQAPAWKKFGRAAIPPYKDSEDGPTLLKFVQCLNPKCGLVKMYSSGTGALMNHNCKEEINTPEKTLPEREKEDFQRKLISFFAGNVLPLSLASAQELHDLIDKALALGREYGLVSTKSLIPHPTTLHRAAVLYADEARSELVEALRDDLEDGMVSATVDGWTDGQSRRKFFGHTVEYIDSNFVLHDNVLFTPYCAAESVTGQVIRDEIKSNLSALSLDPDKVNLHYVTDDGADIVSAVSEGSRTYCADHCTNLVVKKALTRQLTRLTKVDLYGERGGYIVDNVRKAVDTIKSSRRKTLTPLKKKLVKGPTNRKEQIQFRSCLPMLRKVHANFKQVRTASRDLGQSYMENIEKKDLSDLFNWIHTLETIAKKKTENAFVGENEEIAALTLPNVADSELQSELKIQARQELATLPILALLRKCKTIVTFFKTSGLNLKLHDGKLKQEVDTRWMSILTMLESFFPPPPPPPPAPSQADSAVDGATADSDAADGDTDTMEEEDRQEAENKRRSKIMQINQLLADKKKVELQISEEEIVLITVLTPFNVAIKLFEKEKDPTIQHVLPEYFILKNHVAPPLGPSPPAIVKLREILTEQLTLKYLPNIKDRHKVGAFLWPMCAELPFLPGEEREKVKSTVRTMCEEQKAIMLRRGLLADANAPPPPKKRRARGSGKGPSEEDRYAEILGGDRQQPEVWDEVDKYLLIVKTAGNFVKSNDLLKWWKARSADLPVLSRVARMVLATPASSSSSERNFSVAGRVITPRRNCLAPETVDVMLFLFNYLNKKKQLA
ncbi:Transposable element Hobo transposase [Frankliniella fusca]|uniref:Transposable element Hobo transposase n=1 Tax=Frankliniella fusca TaxID=407009 RepID=A0AAE1I2Q7_9NEOP|nr:Transposable element Hobo transposase [Frankliniella fusca]